MKRSTMRVTRTIMMAWLLSACSGDDATKGARLDKVPTGVTSVVATESCNADCMKILRAGVQWLVQERGFVIGSMVIDTVRSGALRNGTRIVPRASLNAFVTEAGITKGRREDFMSCYRQALDNPACATRNRQILVVLGPPQQDVDTLGTATLQVNYSNTRFVPEIGELRREAEGYQLTLQKSATGWVVRDVRHTVTS